MFKNRKILLMIVPILFSLVFSPLIFAYAANETQMNFVYECKPGASVTMVSKDLVAKMPGLTGIVVTQLPDSAAGKLTLDGKNVSTYQTIPKSKIDSLTFECSSESKSNAFFVFRGFNGKDFFELDAKATIKISGQEPPKLSNAVFNTFKDVSISERLRINSTGDYKVVVDKEPKLGEVSINNSNFYYTPYLGKTGKDSFVFHTEDSSGTASNSATVSVTVEDAKNVIKYDDMENHWAQSAAITIARADILQGEKIGSATLFYPDKTVSRSDFLMMVMKTVGINDIPYTAATNLKDDSEIPKYLKSTVNYALEKGIISGVAHDDGLYFDGNGKITRAQAAAIINKALSLEDVKDVVPNYTDRNEVPAWAEQPLINLEANYIMGGFDDGSIRATECLTRAQTAELLCQTMNYIDSQKPAPKSVFSFVLDLFK